jgi:MYXO-CTERM domain-containing protein
MFYIKKYTPQKKEVTMKINLAIGLMILLIGSFSSKATMLFPTTDAIRDNNGNGVADEVASYASDYLFHTEFDESRVFNEFDISWLPLVGITVETATLHFSLVNYENYSFVPDLSNFVQLHSYVGDDNITLEDWYNPSNLLIDTFEITEYSGPEGFEILELSFDISDLVKSFVTSGELNIGIAANDPVAHSSFDPPGLLTLNNMRISLNEQSVAEPVSEPGLFALLGLSSLLLIRRRKR